MDFSLVTYKMLLSTLSDQGFSFSPVEKFISGIKGKTIALRHDVDRLPAGSLDFAGIEHETGIKGTYYFRVVPGSWNERIIREIAEMGHEIGYHYEDLSFAWAKLRVKDRERRAEGKGQRAKSGDLERTVVNIGIDSFNQNLEKLRKLVPVKTICMHGSPLSRWDSRLLWKYYDYHDFGIIAEPYFDTDFNEVLYLTDTGRCWDGDLYNIRDKASGVMPGTLTTEDPSGRKIEEKSEGEDYGRRERRTNTDYSDWKVKPFIYRNINPGPRNAYPEPFPRFHSTFDIIKAAGGNKLPGKIMMTLHPQRWTDRMLPWIRELVFQNMKNMAKYFIVKMR